MTSVLPAARKGDRISHGAHVSSHDGALLSVAAGALVGAPGGGGVATAAVGAGVGSGGASSVSVGDVMPMTTSGAVEDAAPRTFVGPQTLPVALADQQPVDCHHHRDKPIRTGSATVIAENKRMARASDQTHCGAVLCDGDLTVLVGGAPVDSAPPDPLALAAHGAALVSAAVSTALAEGTAAVTAAVRWGETLADEAIGVVDEAEQDAEQAVATLTSQVSAAVGKVGGGLLGPLFGAGLQS
jgi:uncharacterized Zn-binding protein involved in type VI secretion